MRSIKWIIIITGCALLFNAIECTAQIVYSDASLQKQLGEARKNVNCEQFAEAIAKYANLVKNDDNKTVSSEYAYALALSGCYDGAVMNLDKILASNLADADVLFYISRVLRLMEYDTIANLFWNHADDSISSDPPTWLSKRYLAFELKYRRPASINTGSFSSALQRANKLANQRQNIQAMVLFLELIETYSDQYLPYIGLSALMENMGFKQMAIKYLQKGIDVIGKDKQKIDPFWALDRHLEKLKSDVAAEKEQMSSLQQTSVKVPRTQEKATRSFLYTGLTYVNKSLAFSVMYGLYTSPTTNFSLNLGYSRYEKVKTIVGDASFNLKVFKHELIGATISTKYSDGFDVGVGARAGFSFPISNGNSSFDILYNVYYYFKGKEKRNTLSVGFTHYF